MATAAILRRPIKGDKAAGEPDIHWYWDGSTGFEDVPGVSSVEHITYMRGPLHWDPAQPTVDGAYYGRLSLVTGTQAALDTIDGWGSCAMLREADFAQELDAMSPEELMVVDHVAFAAAPGHAVSMILKDAEKPRKLRQNWTDQQLAQYGLGRRKCCQRADYPAIDREPPENRRRKLPALRRGGSRKPSR